MLFFICFTEMQTVAWGFALAISVRVIPYLQSLQSSIR